MSNRKSATQEQINYWLHYAMRCAVKAFRFYSFASADDQDLLLPPIVELPSHARTASIELAIAVHALPVSGSLPRTELNLRWAWFDDDEGAGAGGRTLGDFLSISSPKLSRLVLRTESLHSKSFRVSYARDLQSLDVTAPNLRIFSHIFCLYGVMLDDYSNTRSVIKIVARRLEEIAMDNKVFMNTPDLHIHGLTSIRRLCDLNLTMHGQYCSNRGYGLWLLKNCPNVKHVDLLLESSLYSTDEELADLTDESAPRLHEVRSMVLKTSKLPHHHFTANISLFKDRDTLANHPKLTLELLQEVTIIGFTRTDEEIGLVSLLFGSSSSITSMTIHASRKEDIDKVSLKNIMAENDDDDDDDPTLSSAATTGNSVNLLITVVGVFKETYIAGSDTQQRTMH
uniref:FBD domain-containing protein n=1 Tax=Oryza punctata TaxID=4537 RepID=A0A0E0KAN5_ORYPU